jgi:hypothetical protein
LCEKQIGIAAGLHIKAQLDSLRRRKTAYRFGNRCNQLTTLDNAVSFLKKRFAMSSFRVTGVVLAVGACRAILLPVVC